MEDEIELKMFPNFISGGGEMGEFIRNFDWKKTSLGSSETWPQSLRTTISTCLNSRFPILIWWGPDLVMIYNDAYRSILGAKHPASMGEKGKVVWPEIWDIIGPMLYGVYEKGLSTWSENQLLLLERRGYPEECYFTFSYSPIYDEKNKVGGIFCAVTETTQIVLNQRQSKTTYRLSNLNITNKRVDAVYIASIKVLEENNKDFPCAIVYKIDEEAKFANALAYTGIDECHPELPKTISLERPGGIGKNVAMAVSENRMILSETKGRWKDPPRGGWDITPKNFIHVPIYGSNKKIPVAVLTAALNPYRKFDGEYQNFIQLVADQISLEVNNVIAYNEEWKRAEGLAELDRAKTLFFTNISHEFRTPLTLMLSPLEELLNGEKNNLSKSETQNIETSHRNAMRLLKLVNTLLDFSRIESGRQKANFSSVDIVAFTKNLASNFRSVIETAGLKLIVKADPIPQPVYIDKEMWEKIVLNLLSNAFKYTLKGKIIVELYSKNNHLKLTVKDTGAGIPEKELPHIFDRFHRVENTASRTYEGTGIGLSFVKELVQLHGGNIDAESKIGYGSSFTVSIPFGKEHLEASQIKTNGANNSPFTIDHSQEDILSNTFIEEANSYSSTITDLPFRIHDSPDSLILIVDDNADMRNHIQSLLSSQHPTITAVNGKDALEKIKDTKPALIISDIMMPVMNGFQLLKEVKSNPQTVQIPLILLSARTGEESRIKGYETGADDYLVKPFSAKELRARVKAHLEMSAVRKQAQAAAEDERKRLYQIFTEAPAYIAILKGPDHTFELANPLYLQLVGKDNSILRKRVKEVLPEVESQGFIGILDTVYKTGKPFVAKEMLIKLDRKGNGNLEDVFLNFVYMPYTNAQGKTQGIMVYAVDVSEQVYTRKKLEEYLNHIKTILESLPQIAWTTDAEGRADYFNAKWYEFTGLTESESMGTAFTQVIHPDDSSRVTTEWHSSITSGKAMEIELRIRRSDGKYKWHCIIAVPQYNEQGEITNWIGTSSNIHEQKIKEQKKDEFISIASHEMKTPLATANAYVQLLEASLNQENTNATLFVKKAASSLRRLNELITELLDVSKIKNGKINYNITSFNFDEMMDSSIESIQHTSPSHSIIKSGNVQQEISGDKERLEQVVINLLSNAIKYSPGTEKVFINIAKCDREIKVSVKDNGIGISDNNLKKIFERYYRVEKQAIQFQGLGIGLFISSEIIKRHHGQLWAESEPGKGSTFYFTLPL